jgi:Family of unknown function (DUF6511)
MSGSRGLCAACRRGARSFGWFDARFAFGDPRRVESLRWFCSLTCQDICHRRQGMVDPTRHERAAIDHAIAMAGEHIESLGRTDLMTWSPDEFASLIEVVVTAFTDRLRELGDDDREVPYP